MELRARSYSNRMTGLGCGLIRYAVKSVSAKISMRDGLRVM